MQRGLVHALAWTLATGAAVTLSWWGVHTVMSGTVYDPPRAVPLTALPRSSSTGDAAPAAPAPSPTPSPTPSPGTSAAPSAPASSPATSPSPSERSRRTAADEDTGNVKSYPVTGGRVVFDLGGSAGQLVSATPDADWRMQVWKQTEWIRVNFTRGNRTVSVFCTWNGHPPLVEVVDG
ncbi:hypothetical protein OHS33_13225 [Streptomyces sp. NBC_00536]|uniref:hypothetical protein n=1 Tax=Streptomyces sp. NBC_00536 TaxID=2975769 RepID=UPI002E80B308|nr:hypothetical protein [Streptomyces sp. NBC_00536]WUC79218.1 hypothetical protein OHS33_13225 [Streptomyces sp. NBC_00536]